jgi:hypothetical protein
MTQVAPVDHSKGSEAAWDFYTRVVQALGGNPARRPS